MGSTLKVMIYSSRTKFFSLEESPYRKGFITDGRKQEVTKVVRFVKLTVNHGGVHIYILGPGLEVIKHFSCSTELSMKFQMLIRIKISRNSAFSASDKHGMLFSRS